MNNVPVMMYTPNKENYIQEIKLKPGMDQEIKFSQCQFELKHLKGFDLFKAVNTYFPMVISVNYQKNGKNYAFMSYAIFNKNSTGVINGAHIEKELVLVSLCEFILIQINGIPFEIKSIYGLDLSTDKGLPHMEGEAQEGVVEDGEGKECLICLTETRNTLIMPCGHLCVCHDCGKNIQTKNYTCPICRGQIGSLIPFNLAKLGKK